MTTGPTIESQESKPLPSAARAATGLASGPPGGDDVRILRGLLGADPAQELIDFAGGAGGDPLLLAELALGLVEEGLAKENDGRVELVARRTPRRVLADVMGRLGELSASCQQFLKVASALGRSFMLEDVSTMLGRSSAALLSPLDESMMSGFVIVAEHQLAFRSEFVLQGVVESIPVPAHGALRREAMSISARRTQGHDQKHWSTEHPIGLYGAVKEEAGGSCSRAHSLIMNGDAAAGVRVADRILADPGASLSARLDAEASVILGCFLLGRQEAESVSERVLRERGTAPGDIAALMALTVRSNTLWRAGKLAEALSLGRTAVRYSENVDPVWRLHFQLTLAGKLANLREFDKAEALIADAEDGLRRLPTPVWTAAPAAMRSRLLLQSGRIGDARREAALATAAVERDAVPLLRPLAYSVLSAASFYMEDLPAAVEYLRRAQSGVANQVVLASAQYAWTEMLITVKKEGPRVAARLLSERYPHLPTQRSLYIEDPSAAPFLVRLARDVGDSDLERRVLETVDGLAADNPDISVVGLTAMHANALANGAGAALALIIAQSPDPISVALATEELARLYAARTPAEGHPASRPCADDPGPQHSSCWSELSDMERRIAYLVSVGLTNRQIAKQVYLSVHTVNYHLRKIYRKLGINTRVELAHGAAAYSSRAAIYSIRDEARWDSGHVEDAV